MAEYNPAFRSERTGEWVNCGVMRPPQSGGRCSFVVGLKREKVEQFLEECEDNNGWMNLLMWPKDRDEQPAARRSSRRQDEEPTVFSRKGKSTRRGKAAPKQVDLDDDIPF